MDVVCFDGGTIVRRIGFISQTRRVQDIDDVAPMDKMQGWVKGLITGEFGQAAWQLIPLHPKVIAGIDDAVYVMAQFPDAVL